MNAVTKARNAIRRGVAGAARAREDALVPTAEEFGLDEGVLTRRKGMIRVIKRYESRKLYDTEESRYVSLEDISGWVRDGQEIQVIDNATSDDVTAQILTQVILEEGKRDKSSFLPTELLHELVRGGERLVATGIDKVQGSVEGLVRRGIDRLEPVRRAREEMVHLRERLAELERTLRTLESDPAGDETPARRTAEAKPAAKKPARKPAGKKNNAATAAPKEVVN